jgi:preprotein translocase subunit SecA
MILQTLDMYWVEHLEIMDYMRSSVNLRAYGQRDPLTEYKREGLRYFKEMEASTEAQILKLLPQMQLNQTFAQESGKLKEVQVGAQAITSHTSAASSVSSSSNNSGPKVGRNDPCPCGSGKKYKKCGELNTEEHQSLMAGKK